jgi:L-threonylcarbamoyladenylate synthase
MGRIVAADEAGIELAVAALRRGEVIGLPTETVYGLAADATNDRAVRKIFAIKRRPSEHPLIIHIATIAQLESLASSVSPACRALIEYAWPGPLTVVVPASSTASRVATGGLDTVAVRMPAHPVARAIIERLERPIAAPSANRFGHVSPTRAEHVVSDLGDDVDLVIDGGPCEIGIESTIVDCTSTDTRILRPGAITEDDMARLLAGTESRPDHTPDANVTSSPEVRAPGMLDRHYAPAARVVLHETFATVPAGASVIDCQSDVLDAARGLYSRLRDADLHGASVVHVIMPPPRGLGLALRDRLQKAAAGR